MRPFDMRRLGAVSTTPQGLTWSRIGYQYVEYPGRQLVVLTKTEGQTVYAFEIPLEEWHEIVNAMPSREWPAHVP